MRAVSGVLMAGALLLTGASRASAAVVSWTGTSGGTPPLAWSDGNNWNGLAAPNPNDDLRFPTTGGSRSTTNDFASGTTFNGIDMPGASYTLAGNSMNLGPNGVSFSAGSTNFSTISLPIVLLQDTNVNVAATTGSGRLQWDGGISGNFALNKTNSGMLRMAGTAKTYSGNTNVQGGTLDLNATDVLPFGAGKGNVTVSSGATLSLNNVAVNINGLSDGTGAGAVSKTGSNSRALTVGNGDASGSFGGSITFTGGTGNALTKVGTGTQSLGGTVTIPGAINANGGRLNINGSAAVTTISVANGGTLGGSGSTTAPVTVALGGGLSPGASAGAVGTLTITAALTLNNTSVLSYDLNGTNTAVAMGVNDWIQGITNLTLDGVLNVNAVGSFASATVGQKWQLINYANLTANNTLTLGTTPALPQDMAFQIEVIANQVNLIIISTAVPEASALLFGVAVCALLPARLLFKRRYAAK